jgi:hypothetical protein
MRHLPQRADAPTDGSLYVVHVKAKAKAKAKSLHAACFIRFLKHPQVKP